MKNGMKGLLLFEDSTPHQSLFLLLCEESDPAAFLLIFKIQTQEIVSIWEDISVFCLLSSSLSDQMPQISSELHTALEKVGGRGNGYYSHLNSALDSQQTF